MSKQSKRQREHERQWQRKIGRTPIVVLLVPDIARIVRLLADDDRTSASRVISEIVHRHFDIPIIEPKRRKRRKRIR